MKERQIDQGGSSDFLVGARGSAREHEPSENGKYEIKPTRARSDSSFTSGIILGSQSPRRREILSFFSLPFRQVSSDSDESLVLYQNDPAAYAIEVAKQKAEALAKKYPDDIILTADTVVHRKGRLFLKPETMQEAYAMLRELAGKEHQVYTGVVVTQSGKFFTDAELARVFFTELTDSEIHTYAKFFHPMDKAGGYAIQRAGSLIVKRIDGCYYNVMGLPLQTVRRLLIHVGIDLWDYFKSV